MGAQVEAQCSHFVFLRCDMMNAQQAELLAQSDLEIHSQPRSRARVAAFVFGCAGLAVASFEGGKLRGAQISGSIVDAIDSVAKFKSEFESWSDGLSCNKLTTEIAWITGATKPTAGLDRMAFHTWYSGGGILASDKTAAEAAMEASRSKVCFPAPTAAPAKQAPSPSSSCLSIQDYATFGHCFSAATAGHPWAYILHVEEAVRGVSASAMTAEVSALHNFYKLKASESERHLFTQSALVHMKAHGMH